MPKPLNLIGNFIDDDYEVTIEYNTKCKIWIEWFNINRLIDGQYPNYAWKSKYSRIDLAY